MTRILLMLLLTLPVFAAEQWIVFEGGDGPGKGKHVVLVSGDEEYRSEEALPQLGKILSSQHGFKCTVLFAIDPEDGTIEPTVVNNIPGLEALKSADLMIIATRFRALPDDQMKMIDDYVQSGRPIIGLRTATHAFRFKDEDKTSYRHYDCTNKEWDGGFGKQVLGETWSGHHGHHKFQATRGVIAKGQEKNPIVNGAGDIFGLTDVYVVKLPMCDSCKPLVMGQVLEGMKPTDKPVVGEYVTKTRRGETRKTPNDPMMPVAWTKSFTGKSGKTSRIFTTTMGAATDLESEGFRRLVVNATYWAVGMESKIPARAKVDIVGDYDPTFYGFGEYKKGLRPADYK
jgi:type 1 glutamine amidotransferase